MKRAVLAFFHERGEIAAAPSTARPFAPSGLNLVVSAIVHWGITFYFPPESSIL